MSQETITKNNCRIIPISLKDANKFVEAFHRHSKPVICHKFSLGLLFKEKIIGVIIVGRPVARALDNGLNVEINRCCILPGYKNANSFLYAQAKRICQLMGYQKIITYTLLDEESGSSLKAIQAKQEIITKTYNPADVGKRAFYDLYNKKKIRWELNDKLDSFLDSDEVKV